MDKENWELVTEGNLEGSFCIEYEIGQEIFFAEDDKEFSLWFINNNYTGETRGGFDTCEEVVEYLLSTLK